MNFDIVSTVGPDLKIFKTDVGRAGNVLSVQLTTLEYAQSFGVDIKYFLESEFQLQNSSFKAYLVERLLQHQVNVVNALETIETLYQNMVFAIGDTNSGGLIT